jgi:hypothetical protein
MQPKKPDEHEIEQYGGEPFPGPGFEEEQSKGDEEPEDEA